MATARQIAADRKNGRKARMGARKSRKSTRKGRK